MQQIDEMLREAERQREEMGQEAFSERLYVSDSTPEFTRLKEQLYLGYFAQQHNRTNNPQLVWADHHPPRSDRADFTVYDSNQVRVCDIEVTAIFTKPHTKQPKGYPDYSPFPINAVPTFERGQGLTAQK